MYFCLCLAMEWLGKHVVTIYNTKLGMFESGNVLIFSQTHGLFKLIFFSVPSHAGRMADIGCLEMDLRIVS